MGNCDDPSSHDLTPPAGIIWTYHNGEEATNLLSHHVSWRNNTTMRVSYSCSTWSPPKISSTTRSTGASTKMSSKSVLDTLLPRTYTPGLSRKTRRNSYLRREVRDAQPTDEAAGVGQVSAKLVGVRDAYSALKALVGRLFAGGLSLRRCRMRTARRSVRSI